MVLEQTKVSAEPRRTRSVSSSLRTIILKSVMEESGNALANVLRHPCEQVEAKAECEGNAQRVRLVP